MEQQPLLQKLQERVELLSQIQSEDQRLWGAMTPQHLMEHLGGIFLATAKGKKGKMYMDPEVAPKAKARFFSSYYPFPRNVKMPGTQDQPAAPPLRFSSLEEAREKLHKAASLFRQQLAEKPEQTATHGYFGELTMSEWLAFHIKHLEHHLQQFGVLPIDEKITTLEKLLYKLGKYIQVDTPALWGKMNAQQMVEHLSLVFLVSTGKFDLPYRGTVEDAKRYWDGFVQSDNPWKEVFPPANIGDPRPPRKATIEESMGMLRGAFQKYLAYSEAHPDAVHPQHYLGNLTVDQWRQVHVKHMQHHLRQFGMEV